MTRPYKLCYLAHPVGDEPDRSENVKRALGWLRFLNGKYGPGRRFVAPWLSVVASGAPETDRELWLEVDCDFVRVSDEIWLVGVDDLSPGMRRERAAFGTRGPAFLMPHPGAVPLDISAVSHESGFRKRIDGKPRVELLPPNALLECGTVLGDGAKLHGAFNWREAPTPDVYVAAALRHILHDMAGRSVDESGSPALAHAATDLLLALELRHKEAK